MYNNKAQINNKKKIEIAILIIIAIWLCLFVIDYFRYKDSKKPLIVLKHKTTTFEDGLVEEYKSIGWTYREYKRRAIGDIELTPFWKKMQRPAALNSLPVTKKDYDVPENKEKLDEYKGLVYYFNYGGEVVGTYKCLNTSNNCSKAKSGIDEYDIKNLDIINKLDEEPIFDSYEFKYGWIDDSVNQNASTDNVKQYQRTIYLFDIEKNEILAEFKNIKYSTINKQNRADGYDGTYIVENKDNKWGAVKLTSQGPQTIVNFDYESVNYSSTTNKYIVRKDGKWHLYDQNEDNLSAPFDDPIVEAVYINGETIIKTIKQELIEGNKINTFYLSKIDGTPILTEKNVVSMLLESNFVMYLTYDKNIKVIDYSGNQKLSKQINTYFIPSNTIKDERSPFEINKYVNDDVKLFIPINNEKKSICKTYYFRANTWELTTEKEENCN